MGLREKAIRYRGLKEQSFFFRRHDPSILKELLLRFQNDITHLSSFIEKTSPRDTTLDSIGSAFLDFIEAETHCHESCLVIEKSGGIDFSLSRGFPSIQITALKLKYGLESKPVIKNNFVFIPLFLENCETAFLAFNISSPQDFVLSNTIKMGISFLEYRVQYYFYFYFKEIESSKIEKIRKLNTALETAVNFQEWVFKTFNVLESLGIQKLLVLEKNAENYLKVIDGYGCREKTFQLFHFHFNSVLQKMVAKNPKKNLISENFPWETLFGEEDWIETNSIVFIPLQTKNKLAYFVILQINNSLLSDFFLFELLSHSLEAGYIFFQK